MPDFQTTHRQKSANHAAASQLSEPNDLSPCGGREPSAKVQLSYNRTSMKIAARTRSIVGNFVKAWSKKYVVVNSWSGHRGNRRGGRCSPAQSRLFAARRARPAGGTYIVYQIQTKNANISCRNLRPAPEHVAGRRCFCYNRGKI